MTIQRRTFIQQAGLLSAGFFIAPAAFHSKAPATGLQLWTVKTELAIDLKGTLAKIAAAGYTDLETFGGGDNFFGQTPSAFKQLINDHQLVSTSGHYYFPINYSVDQEFDAVIGGFINAAKVLGQYYVVIPGLPEELRNTADGFRTGAERLNRAGRLCKNANLQLAYHNHDFDFKQCGAVTGYDLLLKETDTNLVKMELDLYFAILAGQDPVALFKRQPGRFPLLHVKDMNRTDHALNTEVGSGSINFKKIFSYTKLAGVKRYFIEQENFTIDPFVSIKKSAEYFKTYLIK